MSKQPMNENKGTVVQLHRYVLWQRAPHLAPTRKGPYPTAPAMESALREMYELAPDSVAIVVDLPVEASPQHGYEWLDMYAKQSKPHPRDIAAAVEAAAVAARVAKDARGPDVPEGWKLVPAHIESLIHKASTRYMAKRQQGLFMGLVREALSAWPGIK